MITSLNFKFSYGVNEGLILSPSELKDLYFYGIKIKGRDATELNEETIKSFIKFAQSEVEGFLGIKVNKQFIEEDKSFNSDDYRNWSFLKTTYPVLSTYSLEGKIGPVLQVKFPEEWLSSKTSNTEDYHRRINIVPNSSGDASAIGVVYRGGMPYWGLTSYNNIPQFWSVKYITGFNRIPQDLISFISKYAAINLFFVASDLILEAGISNQSIGIDGLSQSLSTQGLDGRIKGYLQDLVSMKPNLISRYKGINFMTV